MTTAGPNNAGTVFDSPQYLFSGASWTNPSNAQGADDGVFATITLAAAAPNGLQSKGFGFSIPIGSTITSHLYEVKMKSLLGDATAWALKAGVWGTSSLSGQGSIEPTTTLAWLTTTAGFQPSVEQANDSEFGVAAYVDVNVTDTYSVDAFRITITYTIAGWSPHWPGMNLTIQNIMRWLGWKPKQYTQTRGCGEMVAV